MVRYCARFSQLLIAAALLLLLSPVILLCMLLIRIDSGGDVVFKQVRVGKGLKPFTIYKLRTMTSTPSVGKDAVFSNKEPYMTRAGHVLRVLKLDECLQLLNVLKGEMNFVGPRPVRKAVHEYYANRTPGFEARYSISPGITGLAQIVGTDRITGLACDLYYINHRSLKLNATIVASTILYVFYNILRRVYSQMTSYWLNRVAADIPKKSSFRRPVETASIG